MDTGRMPIRVTFLGTGDAFASGGRSHACVLVDAGGYRLLVDCGAAAPVALRRHDVAPATVDAVVLTHLHGDHSAGIPFLLLDAVYNEPRSTGLTLAGPPGTKQQVFELTDILYPGVAAKAGQLVELAFVELDHAVSRPLGPCAVTAFPAVHGTAISGFTLRLEVEGRVLAFSGDTEWTSALIEASNEADLFVCECTSLDAAIPGHVSHTQLAAHKDELTARRTILTHLGRDVLAHRDHLVFEAADDGMVLEL